MNETMNVILRTILVLIIIFILFKIMGKKQVSQMNMFDYITGITIGSVVADISLDLKKNILSGIICLLIYCLTDILISYLNLKSINLRNFFEGKEVILIENGKMNRKNMSKNKITVNMIQTEARIMGYFHLEEINNAILETNGKISFEPKEKNKPLSKQDMNIKKENKDIIYNLIIDGQIIKENLNHINKDENWLKHELKILGKKKEDILLLTSDNNNHINVYLKNSK